MRQKLIAGILCIISLALITLIVMQIEKSSINPNQPMAAEGVLDLSLYDLAQARTIPLAGEWEFYDGKLLNLTEIQSSQFEELKKIVKVPGMWNEYSMERQEPASFGTGTYHLRILLDPMNPSSPANLSPNQILGIRTTNIGMANRIFVDENMIGGSGIPHADYRSYVPKNVPFLSFFQPAQNSMDLIVWVSNYDYTPYGGIVNDLFLGTQNGILQQHAASIAIDWFGIISFLIIGMMFLSVYLYRRKSIFLLYFSLFSASSAVYLMTHGEKLLYQLLPMLEYRLFARLQYFSAAMFALMLLLYLFQSFPNLFGGMSTKILIGISAVFVPVCFVAPLSIQSVWSIYQMIFIQLVMLYVVYLLTLGILQGIGDAAYVGIGSLAILYAVTVAIGDVLGMVSINAYIPALIVFLLSQAVLIAVRLSRSFYRTEALSEQLLLLDRQKDEFLARTSHEFKTPLHGIINITKLYVEQERLQLSETHRKNLNLVIDIADRLSRMVNDILTMTKVKEGRLAIRSEAVSVNRVVEDVCQVSRFIHDGNGNQLKDQLQDDLPLIHADPDRLKQILYNLIDNAMMHTSRGIVTLKTEADRSHVNISVSDTGSGIEPGRLSVIFDPYVQLNEELKDGDGAGLGLAIVKQLTELLGGKVKVASKVGEGSCFTIQFPIAKEEHTSPSHRTGSDAQPPLSSAPFQLPSPWIVNPDGEGTVLVVDDHDTNRKLLVDILTPEPYRIVAACSGPEALEQLKRLGGADVLILDIMMPGMTGYEVCQKVRETYNLAELPILMLTAAVNTEDSEAALLAGANDFLHKPFQLNEFRARVRSLIAMKQSASLSAAYEIAFLHAQIKPHFLFNALNTIASCCETESPETADLILSLAKYLRGTLDFTNIDNLVSVEKEMALVKAYLTIEQARFPELNIRFDIEEDLNVRIPPLSLQILVENGVKYGRKTNGGEGEILISAKRIGDGIRFSVTDHGPGISEDRIQSILKNPQKEGSIGLYNLHTRLSRMLGSGLEIKSSPDQGTTVSFLVKERD